MEWKQATKAQQWARKRNFSKRLLRGMIAHLRGPSFTETLTPTEKERSDAALEILELLLHTWRGKNAVSKFGFLKK